MRFRIGTKRNMIEKLALRGYTKLAAFSELKSEVIAQRPPMIFKRNDPITRHRVPKHMGEQLVELRNEISRVYAILESDGLVRDDRTFDDFDPEHEFPMENAPTETENVPTETETETETTPDEITPDEPETETDRPVIATGKRKVKEELAYFLKRVREIRVFCERRESLGEILDSISMRPVQAASKLIPAGIPADVLLYSMTIHWPSDARADAGISPVSPAEFSKTVLTKLSAEILSERGIDPAGKHELFGYVLVLAECRQPIMMVGPAGTGKSHLATQLASYLWPDDASKYGETPMSPGASRGDLLGRHTIKDFISSQFGEIYPNGGVFNFEEIDASDPSMLIVLNNALAGNHFYNSANGESYEKSPDFIAFSTANTFGLGANREFTARERLDAATIDRWRMGRVYLPLDETIETEMLYGRI